MEKLQLRSDGIAETRDGLQAAVMLRFSGVTPDDMYFFTYRASAIADVTRIEWPNETNVVILSPDLITSLTALGYARRMTEAEVNQFNDAVAFELAGAGGENPPDPAAVPPGTETPASGPENPPTVAVENPPPPADEPPPPVANQSADSSLTPEQLAELMSASTGKKKG